MANVRLNLKLFRTARQMTQGDIAEKLGVSRGMYCNIEKGIRDSSQDFWLNLQKTFDLSGEEVWGLMQKYEDEQA